MSGIFIQFEQELVNEVSDILIDQFTYLDDRQESIVSKFMAVTGKFHDQKVISIEHDCAKEVVKILIGKQNYLDSDSKLVVKKFTETLRNKQMPSPKFRERMVVECRFKTDCKNDKCVFAHPNSKEKNTFSQIPCKYGTACNKMNCVHLHPIRPTCPI